MPAFRASQSESDGRACVGRPVAREDDGNIALIDKTLRDAAPAAQKRRIPRRESLAAAATTLSSASSTKTSDYVW
jgi:hypothetical protein